jgi:Fe-S-cluster-containing dehydrogenase component
MYKTPEGITMHDPSRCIGCQYCQEACPYSAIDLDASSFDGAGYSVISYNEHRENTQPKWSERDSMIPNGTSSGSEVAKLSGAAVPAMNEFETSDVTPIRKSGVIEKCTFCSHRTLNGLPPACVEACPAKARIFGDQDDPNSEIAKALKTQRSFVLKPEAKTRPNVFYIGKYSARER